MNLLSVGEEYPEGDKHYIMKNLIEVGFAEEVTKQEDFTKAVLDFQKEVKKITEGE